MLKGQYTRGIYKLLTDNLQAYRENPKLGNASDCEQLLAKHNKEIESLTAQINKFRLLLEDAQSQNNLPLGKFFFIYHRCCFFSPGSIIDTPPSVRSGSSASSAAPKPPHTNGRSSVSEESITSIDNPSHNKPPHFESQREGTVSFKLSPFSIIYLGVCGLFTTSCFRNSSCSICI